MTSKVFENVLVISYPAWVQFPLVQSLSAIKACFVSRHVPLFFILHVFFEDKAKHLQIFHFGVDLLKNKFCCCRDIKGFQLVGMNIELIPVIMRATKDET